MSARPRGALGGLGGPQEPQAAARFRVPTVARGGRGQGRERLLQCPRDVRAILASCAALHITVGRREEPLGSGPEERAGQPRFGLMPDR